MMESFELSYDLEFKEYLIMNFAFGLTLILSLSILFFGRRLIKIISSILAWALISNIQLSLLPIVTSITGYAVPNYLELFILLVILPYIASIFYYYPKPAIYSFSLILGFGLGSILIELSGLEKYFISIITILPIVIFSLIQTYFRMDIMVIISTSFYGAFSTLFSLFILIRGKFDESDKIGLSSENNIEFWTFLIGFIVLMSFGTWIQFNTFNRYSLTKTQKAIIDVKEMNYKYQLLV